MNDLNKELGLASPYNQTISLNDTLVRTLVGKPTPASTISLSDGYNLSSTSKFTASNTNTVNIYDAAVAGGWNKSSAVEYTIPAGVYIWSDSTATAALSTGGPFPGGLTIINKGYIMGKGGTGASGTGGAGYNNAMVGGPAMNLSTNVTIDNRAGYIGGGGGGGGALRYYYDSNSNQFAPGGGGAGGGAGGQGTDRNTIVAGGAGGAIGLSGGNGSRTQYVAAGGGAGGRIMPGAGGAGGNANTSNPNIGDSFQGYGGGAGGGSAVTTWKMYGRGGAGGSGGSAGGLGVVTDAGSKVLFRSGGGGGGWGASGAAGSWGGADVISGYTIDRSKETATAGAAGGKAINTNTNTITWTGGFDSTRVFGGIL